MNNVNKPCALIVASTAYHIDKFTWGQIRVLQNKGYEVHVAASFDASLSNNSSAEYVEQCKERLYQNGVIVYAMPFTRFPVTAKNFVAYRKLRNLMNAVPYSLVHCHTPTGGLVARLSACLFRKQKPIVLYTSHGFHFFKGAPLINWMIYYPVEYVLAKYTDCLIVINEEDVVYALKMPAKCSIHIRGVGVCRKPFDEAVPLPKETLGIPTDSVVFLCVGELSKRKNQGLLIRSFANVVLLCPSAFLLFSGEGTRRSYYESIVNELNLSNRVLFLGWRNDIPALIKMADVIVSSALQEGLPVNLIESMMAGKPVIATPCRGNIELASQGGILAEGDVEFTAAMVRLYTDPALRTQLGQKAKEASEHYESRTIDALMGTLYTQCVRVCVVK
jgi:glycosyltransferase EpsD